MKKLSLYLAKVIFRQRGLALYFGVYRATHEGLVSVFINWLVLFDRDHALYLEFASYIRVSGLLSGICGYFSAVHYSN